MQPLDMLDRSGFKGERATHATSTTAGRCTRKCFEEGFCRVQLSSGRWSSCRGVLCKVAERCEFFETEQGGVNAFGSNQYRRPVCIWSLSLVHPRVDDWRNILSLPRSTAQTDLMEAMEICMEGLEYET
jgi:hypothetical protein